MEATCSGNWWSRECGARDLLRVALPLVVSTMSFTIMHFCDRMFLSWFSKESMAAAMPAGMLHWTMMSFPLGVAIYSNTFIAQYHGAHRPEQIGKTVWQSLRIGFYSAPLFLLMAPFAPQIFEWFGHSDELVWLESIYFQVLAFAAGGTVMAASLSSYFIGRSKTRVVMCVTVASAAINVVLDIVWIFGYLGFPAAGIEGAAWATVTAQWFRVIAYALIIYCSRDRGEFQFSGGRRPDLRFLLRMFRFGGPNGLQFVIEGSALTVFGLLMAQIGKNEAAATTLAFSVNMVAFVPMLGVGTAVTTIVGQQIGKRRPDLAVRATWTATFLAMLYTGFFGILYVAAPSLFMLGHAAGTHGFDEIRPLAVILLRFVAAYCLLDAIQLIFVSAIKGAGDSFFVLCTSVVWSVSFVLIGVGGARIAREHDWEMYWWWVLITVWIWLLAAVYLIRFLQGRWKSMSVIEPDESRSVTSALEPDVAVADA